MGKPANKREVYLIVALLIVATVAIYWQVAGFPLLRLDDDAYVQQNRMVDAGLAPSSVLRAFTSPYIDNYIPLVWVSYMVDHDIGENLLDSDSPAPYHVTNAVLHLANVLLLFALLLKLTGSRWRSAFVAALFAVHPLHVESVAWVAERKDVLSTLFWLLTMLAYLRYVEKPGSRRWGVVVLLFALGLMAKPMLVTLPIVLLLLDYWPLRRMISKDGEPGVTWAGLREMAVEKIPLFVLAAAGCTITLWAQRHVGAVATLGDVSPGMRIANAMVAYWSYIAKMFWPAGLANMYIHPGSTLPMWKVIGSTALLIGATAAAVRAGRKRPYIAFGWLWYVITLVPVIGFVQVGWQAIADRYTYVPLIGIFVIIAWAVPDLLARGTGQPSANTNRLLGGVSAVVIVALTFLSYRQVGYWRDDIALCRHAISVNFNNAFEHNNLGAALAAKNQVDAAIREYAIAVQLRPDFVNARCNLASHLAQQGKVDEAMRHFRKALQVDPDCVPAHESLGALLAQKGKPDEAISQFKDALRVDPGNEGIRERLDRAEEQKQNMRRQ